MISNEEESSSEALKLVPLLVILFWSISFPNLLALGLKLASSLSPRNIDLTKQDLTPRSSTCKPASGVETGITAGANVSGETSSGAVKGGADKVVAVSEEEVASVDSGKDNAVERRQMEPVGLGCGCFGW